MRSLRIFAALAMVSVASVFACSSFTGEPSASPTPDASAPVDGATTVPLADGATATTADAGSGECTDFTNGAGLQKWVPNGSTAISSAGLVLQFSTGTNPNGIQKSFTTSASFTHSVVTATLAVHQSGSWGQPSGPYIDLGAQYYGDPPTFEGTPHVDYAFSPQGFDIDVYDRPSADPATGGTGHPIDQHVTPTQISLTTTKTLTSDITWGANGEVTVTGDNAGNAVNIGTSTAVIAPAQSLTVVFGGSPHQSVMETTMTITKICVTLD